MRARSVGRFIAFVSVLVLMGSLASGVESSPLCAGGGDTSSGNSLEDPCEFTPDGDDVFVAGHALPGRIIVVIRDAGEEIASCSPDPFSGCRVQLPSSHSSRLTCGTRKPPTSGIYWFACITPPPPGEAHE